MIAGYSGTPLIKKLGIKQGMDVAFTQAPASYRTLLGGLPEDVKTKAKGVVDFSHFFTAFAADLRKQFPKLKARLKPDGCLWVSWPKGTSKLDTDLNGNIVRAVGLDHGLVDIKVCAIDDDWSGLKFVYRTADRRQLPR